MELPPDGFNLWDFCPNERDPRRATVRFQMDPGCEPGEFVSWLVARLRELGHHEVRVRSVTLKDDH